MRKTTGYLAVWTLTHECWCTARRQTLNCSWLYLNLSFLKHKSYIYHTCIRLYKILVQLSITCGNNTDRCTLGVVCWSPPAEGGEESRHTCTRLFYECNSYMCCRKLSYFHMVISVRNLMLILLYVRQSKPFIWHISLGKHDRRSTIFIVIYLPCSWATCWPVPVSRIRKSLQRSTMIPSASWE